MSETPYKKCADCKWISPGRRHCLHPKVCDPLEQYHLGLEPTVIPMGCPDARRPWVYREGTDPNDSPSATCGPDARFFEAKDTEPGGGAEKRELIFRIDFDQYVECVKEVQRSLHPDK